MGLNLVGRLGFKVVRSFTRAKEEKYESEALLRFFFKVQYLQMDLLKTKITIIRRGGERSELTGN